MLIDNGAKLDVVTAEHISPPLESIRNSDTEMVEVLLERKVDVNQVMPVTAYTGLILAAQVGQSELVGLLLGAGATGSVLFLGWRFQPEEKMPSVRQQTRLSRPDHGDDARRFLSVGAALERSIGEECGCGSARAL